MSIDLLRVTGIRDSRGVITEIKDSLGRVIWAVSGGKVILEVEKITSDTYAGETTYTEEQFILLDIYPKTNGTVKVTYGGLTKTITDTSGAAEPNAQTVYFGTLYGVTDSVATPASGELKIEGECYAFALGTYQKTSKSTSKGYCSCITAVSEWGDVTTIPSYAFYQCTKLAVQELPEGVTTIGSYAFSMPSDDSTYVQTEMLYGTIILPSTIQNIGDYAFATEEDWPKTYLKEAIIKATTPPVLGTYPFGRAQDIRRYEVPKGCVEAYKAADGWSDPTVLNYIVDETVDKCYVHSSSRTILNFDNGMTWSDWCSSNYVTLGLSVSGSNIVNKLGNILYYNGVAVKPTDKIVSNGNYNL